jgi:hypothetical protein
MKIVSRRPAGEDVLQPAHAGDSNPKSKSETRHHFSLTSVPASNARAAEVEQPHRGPGGKTRLPEWLTGSKESIPEMRAALAATAAC